MAARLPRSPRRRRPGSGAPSGQRREEPSRPSRGSRCGRFLRSGIRDRVSMSLGRPVRRRPIADPPGPRPPGVARSAWGTPGRDGDAQRRSRRRKAAQPATTTGNDTTSGSTIAATAGPSASMLRSRYQRHAIQHPERPAEGDQRQGEHRHQDRQQRHHRQVALGRDPAAGDRVGQQRLQRARHPRCRRWPARRRRCRTPAPPAVPGRRTAARADSRAGRSGAPRPRSRSGP
jgi:hypothetical protein